VKHRVPRPALTLWTCVVLGLAVGSCDGGGETGSGPVPGAASNADDLSALVTAVGLENEALAELLSIFSADGTTALFSPDLDWSDATAGDAYDRIDAVATRLREHRPALEAALASLEAKQQAAFAAGAGGGRARYALSLSSFFPSIFGWADGQPKAERQNIVKVLEHGGDAAKAELYGLATELLAEGRLGDPGVDLGSSPAAFFDKLQSGALDDQISMHNLNKDAANELATYGTDAKAVGGRPGDVAASQGASGLVAGGSSYFDLAKRTLGAGFAGVSAAASAAFEKGTALAEAAVEKVQQAEALVTAPIDFVKGEIASALQERVVGFVTDKTGLGEEDAATLVEGLGEDLQGFVQQAAASKEVSEGAEPASLVGAGLGWGGLELSNTDELTGALVTWLDEASGTVKALVSPGPFDPGAVIVLPAEGPATVVGLGEGQAQTAAVEGVTVQAEQTVPVALPDLPAATPEPDASGPDTAGTDTGISGVFIGCLDQGDAGTTYGCIAYQGDALDPESTAFADNATMQCLNAGYRLYAGMATDGDADCRAWCSSKEGSYGVAGCDTPGDTPIEPTGPCAGVTPGNDVCYQNSCYNCCGDCANGSVLIYECMGTCSVSDGGPGGTALCECD
jgi:hypothetical protein